jgi:hypothetical protein
MGYLRTRSRHISNIGFVDAAKDKVDSEDEHHNEVKLEIDTFIEYPCFIGIWLVPMDEMIVACRYLLDAVRARFLWVVAAGGRHNI